MSKAQASLMVSLLTHTILRDMYSCTYNAALNENGVNFHAFSHRKTSCPTLICSNSSSLSYWKMMTWGKNICGPISCKKGKNFHAHFIPLQCTCTCMIILIHVNSTVHVNSLVLCCARVLEPNGFRILFHLNFRFRPEGEVGFGSCLCMKCNIIIEL